MASQRATFELFVRKMPDHRGLLVFAGLEQAIGDLLALAFSPEQIDSIRRWPEFRHIDGKVMDTLAALRFEGDVWSVPEGTVVFPGETLVRVTAPLPQGSGSRRILLASLAYPTLVASKAARIVAAAGGRSLFEFGAARPWTPCGIAGGRVRLHRGVRRNEPRRGRAPAGNPREWYHGPFMGPVVRQRKPRLRGLCTGFP